MIGLERLQAVDRLQRGDRRRGRAAQQRERLRIVNVAFEPGEVEVFQRLGDAHEAFGALAEIEVHAKRHVGAGAVAERGEHVMDVANQLCLGMAAEEIRHHAKARHEHRVVRLERETDWS